MPSQAVEHTSGKSATVTEQLLAWPDGLWNLVWENKPIRTEAKLPVKRRRSVMSRNLRTGSLGR
jgi:hypothetical protein